MRRARPSAEIVSGASSSAGTSEGTLIAGRLLRKGFLFRIDDTDRIDHCVGDRVRMEGEKLLSDHEPSLSREQIEYIRASIAERKRTKQVQERIRYGVMAAMAVLAIVAGFQWFRAERQRENAAQAFKSEAQVTVKLQEQLRQASWASFNQAERQFQLGGWQEGIALLARAIKLTRRIKLLHNDSSRN